MCDIAVDPPGYPIFTLLSQLASRYNVPRVLIDFSQFEFKVSRDTSVAWKINHMCAIFGALCSAMIAITITDILGPKNNFRYAASLVGSVLFSFSPLVWEYSIGGEVFSLNNFFCSMIILFTVRLFLIDQREGKYVFYTQIYMCLGAFFSGLALSNQHSSLLLIVFAVPAVFLKHRFLVSVPFFMLLMFCGVLGLSPYVYTYIAAWSPKPGSWGDTSSIKGLITHIARAEYGTFQLGLLKGSETSAQRVLYYLQHTSTESRHMLFALVVGCIFFTLVDLKTDTKKILRESSIPGKTISSFSFKGKKTEQILSIPDNNKQLSSDVHHSRICVLILVFFWLAYTAVWHCVFSNLPLHAPMPFAVHSRYLFHV